VNRKKIPEEALIDLRRRLSSLPPRSQDRRHVMRQTAELYGISEATLYRALRQCKQPMMLKRSDHGIPRVLPIEKMERFCEVVAAIKIRTSNKKGRHLSTAEAIRLLEEHGIKTPNGFIKAPKSVLTAPTVNRYLKLWGYDHKTLLRQPPAVRFQARYSNECWHFDLSSSDLKHVEEPISFKEGKGHPLLMLYSIVDDRSGVAYQEYHCVYGEDVEAALRFLFKAMSPKTKENFPFQGIPSMIYMDNGPISRSLVFHRVMKYLGVDVRTHMPKDSDGRRVTARAKGKVERPFRTVKEMHETLYHFHKPKNEEEANAWLMQFLLRHNDMEHRSESHSRMEDWLGNLPSSGYRKMCSWERFCAFAREPEKRTVGLDARISVDGTFYEADPDLAGEEVILWWGMFDDELYVEHGDERYGPYTPVGGPIPLHRYRRFKKTNNQKRADRVEALAKKLSLPKAAVPFELQDAFKDEQKATQGVSFSDPDPFGEFTFPNTVAARMAISRHLGMPLARLPQEDLEKISTIVSETLNKAEVMDKVKDYFQSKKGQGDGQ
jgi:hypothetical protein